MWLFEKMSNRPIRAARMWQSRSEGKEAMTCVGGHGYKMGSIFQRQYLAHRVIWAIMTGAWPERHIDHINGDKLDNRWSNLRDVTRKENMRNRRISSNNRSGCHGVSKTRDGESWRARIHTSKGELWIGVFQSLDDAIIARKKAEQKHGYHKNHGRR